jgi:O-antigen/teichoic acid export membrane protein
VKERLLEIGRDSAWYMSSTLVTALIGFIAIPLLTKRVFTPSQFGVFSLINTAIVMGSSVVYTYLASSALRFYPEYEKKGELDVYYSTVFHYIPHFMLLCVAVILPVLLFLPLGSYKTVICLAVPVFAFFTVFNVLLYILRARRLSWQFAVMNIVVAMSRYLLGAGLTLWFKNGVAGPFWGWLGALLICVPVEFLLVDTRKYFSWKKNSRALQKEFLSFGLALVFMTFLAVLLSSIDRYILQFLKGSYQVGLYSVVYTLVVAVETIMVSFIMLAAAPVVIKVYTHEGGEQARVLISRITRYFLILLVPVAIGLWVLRVPVLTVMTSAKYLPAQSTMLPVALGLLFSNLAWLPYLSFFVTKKTKETLVPVAAALALNVGANFLLVPHYGYNGAAWATLISYVLYFAMVASMSRKHLKWDFPWKSAGKVCAAGAVMGLGIYGLVKTGLHGALGLLLMIALGTVIYLVALLVLREPRPAEVAFAGDLAERIPLVRGPVRRHREKSRGGHEEAGRRPKGE